jgi:PAS domain S-box-containing protein
LHLTFERICRDPLFGAWELLALANTGTPTTVLRSPSVFTQDAKSFLSAIIASSDDAIISKDLKGIITTWNEGARRIFGYTEDEMVGQSILRLIPEELHYEEEQILAKLRAGVPIEHHETVRMRKSGERFPISLSISPIRDNGGNIIGGSKIARDISDRRRADDSRFRLAAIVDSADDAIISKDLKGIIKTWNEGARRLFGYADEEMIGQSILRLIPTELHYEEDEILSKLRAGEKIEHYETTRLNKSGEALDVSVTISPIRNRAGEIVGASKIARSIAERKKMEKKLIQSEQLAATGRMAATIAHEINNPLASVMNLIFLARQDGATSEEVREYLATAERELDRVSHIARQTLGYYRDAASPKEIYLHDAMENVLSIYRQKLIDHRIRVDSKFNDLRKISVYSGEIIQIFSNLISNAIDAMPYGGTLSISIAQTMKLEGDRVQIVIGDTGCGIRRENLEKVFEPFFTTKGNLGTGIGLWVSKQLVERHGGHISISSSTEPKDSGTIITISLPARGLGGVKATNLNLSRSAELTAEED